jgi:TRAP-type C4-dicarboxylate transport system permease small subunit
VSVPQTAAEGAAAATAATRTQRWAAAYTRALEWLVIALMAVLAAEVTLGIVFRTFGRALVWYDEIASVLLAWLTFYGAALASAKRAHIGCPELIDALAPRARRYFDIAAQVLVIAFFALLAWVGASILPVLATDHLVSLPAVPMSLVQSVIPISALLVLVAEAMHLWALLHPGAALGPGTGGVGDATQ